MVFIPSPLLFSSLTVLWTSECDANSFAQSFLGNFLGVCPFDIFLLPPFPPLLVPEYRRDIVEKSSLYLPRCLNYFITNPIHLFCYSIYGVVFLVSCVLPIAHFCSHTFPRSSLVFPFLKSLSLC